VIVVEPLRRQETNMINTTAEGLRWIEAVGHPSFELMVDLYTWPRKVRTRVFPLRADEYDYCGFLSALRRIRYNALMSIEAKTDNLAVEGPKAIAFVRAACAAAGEQGR